MDMPVLAYLVMAEVAKPKPLVWMGSSRKDLKTFPEEFQDLLGYTLYLAQMGGKHPMRDRLGDSVVQAFWNSSMITQAGLTERYTQSVFEKWCTCCRHSRRNPLLASRSARKTLTDHRHRLKQSQELHKQEFGK